MNQIKVVLSAAALSLCITGVQAQDEPARPGAYKAAHECLVTATDADWNSLELTADQVAKVKEIQAEYQKARSGDANAQVPTADKVAEKLKAVLGPERYEKYVDWCAANAE
ncbi:MAG: hypothetical protein IT230_03260 [Flavobacteriales bacterium]|nr:hypothetical protein [Flavobacteriales bacterium]